MNKESVREFYSAPTRYLAEAIGKESEFEKPYLDDEYNKMHFDLPVPDWPSTPPPPEFPPLPPIEGPGPVPGCAITCYGPLDCEEPVWCHPSIWCGQDMDCTLCGWEVEGATTGYTPHGSGGAWGIDVWLDQELLEVGGQALVSVCMTDPCGNICCEDVEVQCSVCPPDVVISWDTVNSAETIAQGNGGLETALVYVEDGVGPYSWSVAGTGFSMLHATTDGVVNTLQADATACGTATITVTDYCGDTAVGEVRCETGTWAYKSAPCGDPPVPFGDHCYVTEGKTRTAYVRWCYNGTSSPCDEGCWAGNPDLGTICNVAQCGGASPCQKWVRHINVWEWECAP